MSRWKLVVIVAGMCLAFSLAAAACHAAAATAATPKSDTLTPLALDQVKVAGEFGRRIQITLENSLLNLDVDTLFLRPFREKKTKSGYTGLGMLIDTSVRLAVHTGDSRVLALKNHLVKTLIDSQEPDGYLGEFDRAHRLWSFVDVQELAYLIQGLLSDYRYFREERSLVAARKQADHMLRHWDERPEDWLDKMGMTFHMTATGVERAIYPCFESTGDPKYREFCLREMGVPTWNFPIVLGRHRPLEGHVYAYMSRCLAQLEWYRHDPAPALLTSTRRALDFMLHGNGMVVTGGCSDHECWHDTQTGTVNLTETCALVYILKVLDNLLQLEGNSLYGDIMERALYNALFSVQSPDGRRLRYYTPFDGPRSYYPKDTYCCPNNYRRSMGHLPEWIYYRSADGVTVNLYSASSARVMLASGVPLSIAQETDYPNSGTVKLRIDPEQAAAFSVSLRIPRWCDKAAIHVNGAPVRDTIRRGTFHTIRRTWKPGDRLELSMPMAWRFVKGRQAQAGKVAILRGPVVFGLDPSQEAQLKGILLGTITLDTASIEGPLPDSTVRPEGLACTIRAWKPGAWYPRAKPLLELRLTELPDPKSQAIYFHVPNPMARELSEDEIFGQPPIEDLSEDDIIGRP